MCVLDDRGWSRMGWKKPQLNISKIMVLTKPRMIRNMWRRCWPAVLSDSARQLRVRVDLGAFASGCIWQSVINAAKCVCDSHLKPWLLGGVWWLRRLDYKWIYAVNWQNQYNLWRNGLYFTILLWIGFSVENQRWAFRPGWDQGHQKRGRMAKCSTWKWCPTIPSPA